MTRVATFALWGGLATVCTTAHSIVDHDRAIESIRSWIDHVDAVASTYRADSEISLVNAAQGEPTRVGAVLREALLVALDTARMTEGLVDPTVGSVTLPGSPTSIRKSASYLDVLIEDDESGAVITLPADVQLDLGATTKAWAADQAAQLGAAACGAGVLVNLLGDIAISGPAPDGGWAIAVADDHREGTRTINAVAQTIAVTQGGLATSGTTVRQRHLDDGSLAAHIIDPRTMTPVFPLWRTASVAAADCRTANSASTAAIILGENAVDWLERSGLPARLVSMDGEITYVAGWPAAA